MPVTDPSFIPNKCIRDASGAANVRLSFSKPVNNNAALVAAASYTVAGHTVSSAAAIALDPNSVMLTLDSLPDLNSATLVTVVGAILDATSTYQIGTPGNTVEIGYGRNAKSTAHALGIAQGVIYQKLATLPGATASSASSSKPQAPVLSAGHLFNAGFN